MPVPSKYPLSRLRPLLVVLPLLALSACAGLRGAGGDGGAITAEGLLAHIRTLASDRFEGRAPGSAGEDLTVAYLEAAFRGIGLAPGNPDGTYVQEVPLVGIVTRPEATLTAGGKVVPLAFPTDFVAVSRREQEQVSIVGTDVVFVGYGVVAPEYGWDDYKGVDVRGKTIVMLVNDPPVADAADPTRLDSTRFKGRAMTYYGRWTYKYEIAAAKGAAAAIIVHETGPAGYPYAVVQGSRSRENFDIERPGGGADRAAFDGWITEAKARDLMSAAGQDFDALKAAAARPDFRPVALDARLSIRARNAVRHVASRNVVARLPGTDPAAADEVVLYTAHWDHLGRDTTLQGDQVFNGAVDNATGTAALLEIARTLARDPLPRSVVFLAVTAEEKGLLGSSYYAAHPLYPLARTVGVVNIDGLGPFGRTRDVVVAGFGNTTLEDLLAEEAARQGRHVAPDPEPENGGFYRSDHFPFAKRGVPALSAGSGIDFVGRPEGYGKAVGERFTAERYHKPADEITPDWDLSGAVEDARLFLALGRRLAQPGVWPSWKPGTEFGALRDEMLRAAR